MTDDAFFQPGRNCDSVRHADRFSLLIDGSDYFRVLREAITRAQRTVFILGWDIDSRMKLTPEGADDGYADDPAYACGGWQWDPYSRRNVWVNDCD